MDNEISETLFGWRIIGKPNKTSLLAKFSLTVSERAICVDLVKQFFFSNKSLDQLLLKKCESQLTLMSQKTFDKILMICDSVLSGVGPLSVLLESDAEEISASLGIVRIYEKHNGWVDTQLEITSPAYLVHVADKLSAGCGRRLTRDEPVLNAFLPNGTRIHVVSPPVSPVVSITIRKFPQVPYTMKKLTKSGLLSNSASILLVKNVASNSILVCGNTGSGKTTTLNALLATLPANDRFVFVEDVSEITLPMHNNKARLLADKNTSLSQLIYESLRMRPDRLVVSEVRNELEVKAFANALLSGGGKTCYSTFHASSAKEALRRLRLLGFKKADLDSIGLIVIQKRIDDKKTGKEIRRITEIAKVKNGEAKLLFTGS